MIWMYFLGIIKIYNFTNDEKNAMWASHFSGKNLQAKKNGCEY